MKQDKFIEVFDQYVCSLIKSGQFNDSNIPINRIAGTALLLMADRSKVELLTDVHLDPGGFVDAEEVFHAFTEHGA